MNYALMSILVLVTLGCASTETGFACPEPGGCFCGEELIDGSNVNLVVARVSEDYQDPALTDERCESPETHLVSLTIEQVIHPGGDGILVGDAIDIFFGCTPTAHAGEAYLLTFVEGDTGLIRVAREGYIHQPRRLRLSDDGSQVFCEGDTQREYANISFDDAVELMYTRSDDCYASLNSIPLSGSEPVCNDTP